MTSSARGSFDMTGPIVAGADGATSAKCVPLALVHVDRTGPVRAAWPRPGAACRFAGIDASPVCLMGNAGLPDQRRNANGGDGSARARDARGGPSHV